MKAKLFMKCLPAVVLALVCAVCFAADDNYLDGAAVFNGHRYKVFHESVKWQEAKENVRLWADTLQQLPARKKIILS